MVKWRQITNRKPENNNKLIITMMAITHLEPTRQGHNFQVSTACSE